IYPGRACAADPTMIISTPASSRTSGKAPWFLIFSANTCGNLIRRRSRGRHQRKRVSAFCNDRALALLNVLQIILQFFLSGGAGLFLCALQQLDHLVKLRSHLLERNRLLFCHCRSSPGVSGTRQDPSTPHSLLTERRSLLEPAPLRQECTALRAR